ncbi:MAG: ribonuclease E activity regulator RraA [Chromatiaceae bacterium]
MDLCDRFDARVSVCDPVFRDFGGLQRFAGAISTVKCFEDNSLVKSALGQPGNGRALVVDAGGSLRCAMLGDLLAASAVSNGWRGVLMYGCVRDCAEISAMPLGIKALGVHPRKSVKRGEGQRDVAVRFAGAAFGPGDFVYCDEDGILVSAVQLVADHDWMQPQPLARGL